MLPSTLALPTAKRKRKNSNTGGKATLERQGASDDYVIKPVTTMANGNLISQDVEHHSHLRVS